jgi:hypothetical protein
VCVWSVRFTFQIFRFPGLFPRSSGFYIKNSANWSQLCTPAVGCGQLPGLLPIPHIFYWCPGVLLGAGAAPQCQELPVLLVLSNRHHRRDVVNIVAKGCGCRLGPHIVQILQTFGADSYRRDVVVTLAEYGHRLDSSEFGRMMQTFGVDSYRRDALEAALRAGWRPETRGSVISTFGASSYIADAARLLQKYGADRLLPSAPENEMYRSAVTEGFTPDEALFIASDPGGAPEPAAKASALPEFLAPSVALMAAARKCDVPADAPMPPVIAAVPPASSTKPALCTICMDRAIEIVCVPCGHLCMCGPCSAAIVSCPICRAHVAQMVKTYAP